MQKKCGDCKKCSVKRVFLWMLLAFIAAVSLLLATVIVGVWCIFAIFLSSLALAISQSTLDYVVQEIIKWDVSTIRPYYFVVVITVISGGAPVLCWHFIQWLKPMIIKPSKVPLNVYSLEEDADI